MGLVVSPQGGGRSGTEEEEERVEEDEVEVVATIEVTGVPLAGLALTMSALVIAVSLSLPLPATDVSVIVDEVDGVVDVSFAACAANLFVPKVAFIAVLLRLRKYRTGSDQSPAGKSEGSKFFTSTFPEGNTSAFGGTAIEEEEALLVVAAAILHKKKS